MQEDVIICPRGLTEQECRFGYEKGFLCNRIYTVDTASNEPYYPENCMYYQQYQDQLIAEDERRNGLEESAEELEEARKESLKVLRGLGSELTW